jgi:hypothetical protein
MPTATHIKQKPSSDKVQRANRRAEALVSMLQGSMALEGQGLPPKALVRLRKKAVAELLGA